MENETKLVEKTPLEKACEIVGGQSKLAGILGVTPQAITAWLSYSRPIPILRCSQIEQATDGKVTRKDLRPDDWHLIWTELKEGAL